MIRRTPRRRRLSDDPYARHKSDLDLTHGMHASSVRTAAVIIAVGIVIEALFNGQGLAKWSQGLPENPVADWVVIASFRWHDWMRALGTAEVFDAVRQAFYALRHLPTL
jgi:hypothetical protein